MSGTEPNQTERATTSRPAIPRLGGTAAAALLATAVATGLPSAAEAQQWLVTPVVEIGFQHIDNPRLIEDGDTDTITGGLIDVAAEMRRNTQISSILFRPAVALYRYSGNNDEDSEAYFLDFDANRRGQRSDWRLRADFSREQVFRGEVTQSEIVDIEFEDFEETGSGRTFVPRERDRWRVRPGASFDVTERMALKLGLDYINTSYDTQEVGEAVDFTNGRIDASIVRALTPDSKLEFGVFASQYDPDTGSGKSESVGVRARYQKDVSNISSFFVDVGAQETDVPSLVDPGSDVSETTFPWNIGYIRRLERTNWRFELGQAVTPDGSGFLVERNIFRATMLHQLRPRWHFLLAGVIMNTDTLAREDVVRTNDRDYAQGRASLSYEMTRNWTVEGSYILTHQDFDDRPGDAQKHEARLSLIYQPPVPTQ